MTRGPHAHVGTPVAIGSLILMVVIAVAVVLVKGRTPDRDLFVLMGIPTILYVVYFAFPRVRRWHGRVHYLAICAALLCGIAVLIFDYDEIPIVGWMGFSTLTLISTVAFFIYFIPLSWLRSDSDRSAASDLAEQLQSRIVSIREQFDGFYSSIAQDGKRLDNILLRVRQEMEDHTKELREAESELTRNRALSSVYRRLAEMARDDAEEIISAIQGTSHIRQYLVTFSIGVASGLVVRSIPKVAFISNTIALLSGG